LKAQSLLVKRDPDLAAHFKAMADHAYGRLAAIMDEEAKRQTLGAIRYTEDEHKLNPFLGTNKTAQGAFMQRDPALAKFYSEEAKPVSLPLFGPNRNLTIEGRLLRDPAAASLLKVGNVILRQWLETDKAAALEQRAAAEKEIERLQAQAGIA
jgi:hypothetical protein